MGVLLHVSNLTVGYLLMDTWNLDSLAAELVSSCDMDVEAARKSAELYLEQIDCRREVDIDRNNISERDAMTVIEMVMNGIFALTTTAQVDALVEVSERVVAARQLLDARTRERTVLVKEALASGVPIPMVTSATGLSRARVYQIQNAK